MEQIIFETNCMDSIKESQQRKNCMLIGMKLESLYSKNEKWWEPGQKQEAISSDTCGNLSANKVSALDGNNRRISVLQQLHQKQEKSKKQKDR